MNLLAILHAAARRVGVSAKSSDNIRPACSPDSDLADRIEHGLGRPMNRRELFGFAAIAAAVGVPAVREVLFAPLKTIVIPPPPALESMLQVEILRGGKYGEFAGASVAETVAAQYERVRENLQPMFHNSGATRREEAEFRAQIRAGQAAPSAERMVGGLYVPDGVALPSAPAPIDPPVAEYYDWEDNDD